jgi:alkylation response protein AidB-like acyl-CoA dehydrogenase
VQVHQHQVEVLAGQGVQGLVAVFAEEGRVAQALQHRLVDCYAREEQARSMLYRAALTDRADAAKWQRAAAGAKAFIGENVDAIAREAVQMHGGMGITDELAVGHALKRVLLLARLFGDVDTVLAEYALAA